MKGFLAALIAAIIAALTPKHTPPAPPPPEPTHDPTPPPAPPPTRPTDDLPTRLGAEILHYNTTRAAFILGPVYNNAQRGVVLHEIEPKVAASLGATIVRRIPAGDADTPLALCLALIGSESAFDPNAQNCNYDGSNTAHDPFGCDVGLCQLKLRYVDANDADEARQIALDPYRSLGVLIDDVRANIAWAADVQDELGARPEPSARNIYWLAVAAYKHGKSDDAKNPGALYYARTRTFPRNAAGKARADQVADLELYFASRLGLPTHMQEVNLT